MQVQVGSLEGATFKKVATIVRGVEAFTFPRTELEDLHRLVRLLLGAEASDDLVVSTPEPVNVSTLQPEPEAGEPEPVVEVTEPEVPSATREAKLPEMWDIIRGVLAGHPNAVGDAVLVKAARMAGYTGENLTTRVRMVLSRRGKTGLVETTVKGRYRLVRSSA